MAFHVSSGKYGESALGWGLRPSLELARFRSFFHLEAFATLGGFGSQPYNDGYEGRQDRSRALFGGGVAVRGHYHFARAPRLVLAPAIGAGLIEEWFDAKSAGGSLAACELTLHDAAPYLETDFQLRVEFGRHSFVVAPYRFSVIFPTFSDTGAPTDVSCFGGPHYFGPPSSTTTPGRFFGVDGMQAHVILFNLGYAVAF